MFQPYGPPATNKLINPNVEKRKDISGCDWLHEISITVRQVKTNIFDFERFAHILNKNTHANKEWNSLLLDP